MPRCIGIGNIPVQENVSGKMGLPVFTIMHPVKSHSLKPHRINQIYIQNANEKLRNT